jgi:hypothetical protein
MHAAIFGKVIWFLIWCASVGAVAFLASIVIDGRSSDGEKPDDI